MHSIFPIVWWTHGPYSSRFVCNRSVMNICIAYASTNWFRANGQYHTRALMATHICSLAQWRTWKYIYKYVAAMPLRLRQKKIKIKSNYFARMHIVCGYRTHLPNRFSILNVRNSQFAISPIHFSRAYIFILLIIQAKYFHANIDKSAEYSCVRLPLLFGGSGSTEID